MPSNPVNLAPVQAEISGRIEALDSAIKRAEEDLADLTAQAEATRLRIQQARKKRDAWLHAGLILAN